MKIPGSETKSRRPKSEKLNVMISLDLGYRSCDPRPMPHFVLQGSVQRQLVVAPLEFFHYGISHRIAFVGSDRNLHKVAILSGRRLDLHHYRQMV
jgi:hypothetical protein